MRFPAWRQVDLTPLLWVQAFEGLLIGGFNGTSIGWRKGFVDLFDITAEWSTSFCRVLFKLGTIGCPSSCTVWCTWVVWLTPETLSLTFNVWVKPGDANNTKLITATGTYMTVVVNKVRIQVLWVLWLRRKNNSQLLFIQKVNRKIAAWYQNKLSRVKGFVTLLIIMWSMADVFLYA